ncbi:MAG: SpoIIE family protein phosphatase [Candidatus Eisenbacteria bacterium]|nr:SpoIIE family protein phosphatase [Candidatus Eisenbacteria bacterium]
MTVVRKILGDRSEKRFNLEIPGEERYLVQVREFVDKVCAELNVASTATNAMKLAIDEASTNIIKHSYRSKKGSIKVTVVASGSNRLTISLTDNGESFDLQKVRVPDLRRYVATGRKGGLGLFLMNRLMDDVNYNVTPSGNVLTMRKDLLGKRKRPPLAWKRPIWHKSLRFKFSLYASAILFAIVASAFFYFVVRQDRTITIEVIARSKAISAGIARQSTELLLSKEPLSVEQTLLNETIVRTLKENPQIAGIMVVDREGNIWASDKPAQVFASYEAILSESQAQDKGYRAKLISLSTPIAVQAPGSAAAELGRVYLDIRRDALNQYMARARGALLGTALLVLALGNVAVWFVVSRFVKPLQKLSDGVRAIGEGMLDRKLDEGGPDEIDEIARTFNEITARFKKAQQNLVEQERLQKEMQVAQEIQQSLLPREVPTAEGFEIGTLYRAAKEVGGDYYDFVWVDDDTLGVVVADVSGKGVAGSLVMTMIRTALRMEARGNRSAKDVVARMNSFVTDDMKKGMFVTIFYMVLDSRHRVISFASAGHNPMILYRGDSGETYFLNPKGFPVGIDLGDRSLFEKSIGSESIKLKQADMLIIYTDGITEAMNKDGELFGEERFLRVIKKYGQLPPQEFARTLDEEVAGFTGGEAQNDDITLVAIKERAVVDDILYDVRKKLIDLVEVEGMSVNEACEIMKVSPSSYYKYKKRMHELGEEGLRDKIPRSLEKLGRVSLEVEQKILMVAKTFPSYGPKRISRELSKAEFGSLDVSPGKIYLCLKKLDLGTKDQRKKSALEGTRKIMNLDMEDNTGYPTAVGLEPEEVHSSTQPTAVGEEESK